VRPLSEHVMLHLRYGGDERARNFLLRVGAEVVGYAHLDTTDAVEGASAELAVGPRHRGKGYGRQLVDALVSETTDRTRLRLWAHGTGSGEQPADLLGDREHIGVGVGAGTDDRDHCCRKQTSTSHLANPSRS
ncbi:MAG TPA: GNAT family N-acetyltransferase, partial [Mycobacteriales bacterium]|nr:GNAT family N-acetyltransferase [Mycobacteriales bacterium]